MEVERLRISEESYKSLYDEQKEKVEYLEKFIGDSTVEKIKADKKMIDTLKFGITYLANLIQKKE